MIRFNDKINPFLTLLYPAPIKDTRGNTWPSAAHLFYAQRTFHPLWSQKILHCTHADELKRAAKTAPIRKDWNSIRTKAMKNILIAKFSQNPALLERLLNIEPPFTYDTKHSFWGNPGKNMLGILLENVRDILQNNPEPTLYQWIPVPKSHQHTPAFRITWKKVV